MEQMNGFELAGRPIKVIIYIFLSVMHFHIHTTRWLSWIEFTSQFDHTSGYAQFDGRSA